MPAPVPRPQPHREVLGVAAQAAPGFGPEGCAGEEEAFGEDGAPEASAELVPSAKGEGNGRGVRQWLEESLCGGSEEEGRCNASVKEKAVQCAVPQSCSQNNIAARMAWGVSNGGSVRGVK